MWVYAEMFFLKMATTQYKNFSLYCNRDHSILRCFGILPNFSFTTSETERDY